MAENGARRLHAKKFNEHIRLIVTTINALALILVGAGFVQPVIEQGPAIFGATALGWIGTGFALHLSAHATLRMLKDDS